MSRDMHKPKIRGLLASIERLAAVSDKLAAHFEGIAKG